jgi:hypothetical protein
VAALAVALLGSAAPLPVSAQLALAGCVSLVLSAEVANSALEALVDLVTREHHPLARTAKDAGAGAVLVLAAGSVVVGCLAVSAAWPDVASAAAPRWRALAALACLGAQAALLTPYRRSRGVDAALAAAGAGLLAAVLALARSVPFAGLAVALFAVACAAAWRRGVLIAPDRAAP